MDPLSVTASIIATIQIADRIITTCKSYITTVRDAPNDLLAIVIEVGSVKCVLELLDALVSNVPDSSSDVSCILQQLKGDHGPLEECMKALQALGSLLPEHTESVSNGKRRKIILSLSHLAWPLKESKARKLLEDIGRYKATISLALTTETVYVTVYRFVKRTHLTD